MYGGVTMFENRLPVQGCAVAFVAGKFIFGKFIAKFKHQRIARGFGKDGSTCNAKRTCIAFDDGGLGEV